MEPDIVLTEETRKIIEEYLKKRKQHETKPKAKAVSKTKVKYVYNIKTKRINKIV